MKTLIGVLTVIIIGLIVFGAGCQQIKIENRDKELSGLRSDTSSYLERIRSLRQDTTLALYALRQWGLWQDSLEAVRASEREQRLLIEGRLSYWKQQASTIQPDTLYATCDSIITDIDFTDWLERVRPLQDRGGAGADSGG